MTHFDTPRDWKSEVWWRKRQPAERLFHLHLPPRIKSAVGGDWDFDWTPGTNLFIQGPAGSGKSVRAAQLLCAAVAQDEVSGRWVEADDYIEMIKDSFDNDGLLPEMYSTPHLVKYVKGVFDVVVIDGLGEERLTEFAAHELGSLIRKRYDRNKSTIITSRLTIGQIKDRYADRLAVALSEFDMEVLKRGRE